MTSRFRILQLLAVLALAAGVAAPAAAQDDERQLGWDIDAEVAGVWTAGNSESNTLGFGLTASYTWPRSLFSFEGGTARTQSTFTSRTASGTVGDFDVTETSVTEKTAEFYFARGRYDYDFTKRFYGFGGVDWLRNQFSGIDSRFLIALGAGNIWSDTEKLKFKTDYAFTYTFQEEVVENPLTSQSFPGIRLSYDLTAALSSTTSLESRLFADFNLDYTDDIRVDWRNALPVKISDVFALKPSWRLLWRNAPALEEIPLNGGPDTVPVELEATDSIFTLSLVANLK